MNKTKIEWCDYTWNPIIGCSLASPGCAHCYAAGISTRFKLHWNSALFMPTRLEEPARIRKPGRVFVGSMTDIGHETVREEWRKAIYDAMAAAPWHQYIFLTKRPGPWLKDLPEGIWIGVSAEDQAHYTSRWMELTAHVTRDANVNRFISVEPMLGPVSFREDWCLPDWVICGPETGPAARPYDLSWVAYLARQCKALKVPFFDKTKPVYIRRQVPKGMVSA